MNACAWSVIVPTYNRPEQLARCLRAIAAMDLPRGGVEVVVVNDGGTDPRGRGSQLVGIDSLNVRFISHDHAGPGETRNSGARSAVGRWLAFTDDDCLPEAGWLVALERTLERCPDALIGGVTVNVLSRNIFSEASQVLAGFVSSWFDGNGRERFFTSNNMALSRLAFLEVGGFDRAFSGTGEDREFCDRWFAQGRISVQAADAVVQHAHTLSLLSFVRQHFAYGRGALAFRRVRSAGGRPVRVDPGFYLASIRHAARARPLARGLALAGCTLIAHAAYLAGLAGESLRKRREHADGSAYA